MIAEIDERRTADVWILYDNGSAATVCPHGFQEELGAMKRGPRCEAATGNAATLGGAREVPVEISETYFSFRFRVAKVTKPIVSAEGLFQAGCTTNLQDWRWFVIAHSGKTITLHRQQRTYWMKGRISTGGELEVLPTAVVRTNSEVQGLPVMAQDPSDERAPEAASSSTRPVLPMPESRPDLEKPW